MNNIGELFSSVVMKEGQKAPDSLKVSMPYIPPAKNVYGNLPEQTKKPRKKREVKSKDDASKTEIVKEADIIVEPSIDSYSETNNLLRGTLCQLDSLYTDIKNDFDVVRNTKTLKGRYQYSSQLSANLSSVLANKITAIREMNSSIKSANELDYKKDKDKKAANANQNDDKYLMDMYTAFVQNPTSQTALPDGISPMNVLGPSSYDMSIQGQNINPMMLSNNTLTSGFNAYSNNRTPEQNMMKYENDPNVKQVVVYDQSTGYKRFAVMNIKTGEEIKNVPVRDEMFMDDTTLDLNKMIARNINLNESYPIVIINKGKSFN